MEQKVEQSGTRIGCKNNIRRAETMSEVNELPIEVVDEWVLAYLKYHINKDEELSDSILSVEGMLFYARDYLLDQGLKEKNADLVNQAKTINSLVNILRGKPARNYWNGCLRDRGLPIDKLIFR
jgi:hypothetical protein